MSKKKDRMQPYLRKSFKARITIAKNYGKKMEVCKRCKKWVLFKDEVMSEFERKKVCPYCLCSRVFEIAACEFKNENGHTYRKNPHQGWRMVDLVLDDKGLHIKDVSSELKTPALQLELGLRRGTFFPY